MLLYSNPQNVEKNQKGNSDLMDALSCNLIKLKYI